MSQRLISHSPDLKRLRDEGFPLSIRSGYLLVEDVPYVNAAREVKRGTLVTKLTLAMGNLTSKPESHQAYFIGEHPCDQSGRKLEQIAHGERHDLAIDVIVDHSFSTKPKGKGA